MYSITQSPSVALDLAHAIMDENLRRAAAHRRTPKQSVTRPERPRSPWRPGSWVRRPAPAF